MPGAGRARAASPGGLRLPLAAGRPGPRAPREALTEARLRPPRRPVYSNVTAARYADDPGAIPGTLADHLISPVRFREQIEAMYEAGPGSSWKSARGRS